MCLVNPGVVYCAHLPLAPKDIHLLVRHSLVLLLEGWSDLVLEVGQELFIPESQGLGVVPANVLDLLDYQGALVLLFEANPSLCSG